MKIRIADYIANRIVETGTKHVFLITGGGAMFLNDGVASHSELKTIFNHHEQASMMAAVGYAKYCGGLGVVMPTTGCASTNTITGVLDAWQDNTPCLIISGQVRKFQTTHNNPLPLRQIGVQEANVVEIVKSITKYAVMINDPQEIAYHIDKAIYLAYSGRSGPVWLDIPMDVQSAFVETDSLKRFIPDIIDFSPKQNDLLAIECYLKTSKRPIILVGNGVRLAHAQQAFQHFVEKYHIPTVATFLGLDLLPTSHPLNIGRVGVKGTRAGNFAMQNADLILAIGTRLGVSVTGFDYDKFGREAKLVVVDIDEIEHQKNTVRVDHFIHADAKQFLEKLECDFFGSTDWAATCLRWRNQWPVCLSAYDLSDKDGISLYTFTKYLSQCLRADDVVISDAGSAFYVAAQALSLEKQQRYLTSGGQGDMGFTIPACIGACVAHEFKDVIGITGDGSFQTNIQELQTLVHYQMPVKLFIWNNNGYLSNRTTQRKFFEDRFIGADKNSGVSLPSLKKIAKAYGIAYFKISKIKALSRVIRKVLKINGPVICEVMCRTWDEVIPTLGTIKLSDNRLVSRPLEDMFPFLSRKEFLENMIVKPLQEQ